MSARAGEAWFVPRMSRGNPPRGKGIVPISRAGYLTFFAFVVGETAALALGMWIIFSMPDQLVLGIAVIVVGVGLSMSGLFLTVHRRTDYSTTLNEWRARQRQNG